jgi:hypothetical protein
LGCCAAFTKENAPQRPSKKDKYFIAKKSLVLLWVDLGTVDDLVFLSSQNGPREIGG